jgi:hypothetical protein
MRVLLDTNVLLDSILTDFAHSPLPVWDPAELLKRLAPGGSPPITGQAPGP